MLYYAIVMLPVHLWIEFGFGVSVVQFLGGQHRDEMTRELVVVSRASA
jgi:hypothetical protein